MALSIVAGTTAPIDYQLFADGVGYNLSGCTVALVGRTIQGASITFTGSVAVTDQGTGKVRFSPSAADLSTAGKYLVRFAVTRGDAKIEYFPSSESPEQWTVSN